jgi:CubicO group peptidase (beta-lactamase class C family)
MYEESTYWSPSWVSYSGLVMSNIEDLGKWINAFGTGALLSKESYQAMMTPVRIKKDTPNMGFGLGFAILNSWLIQDPKFGGYSGFFAYLPSQKLSIIVFNTLNSKDSPDNNYSKNIVGELIKKIEPNYLIPKIKK